MARELEQPCPERSAGVVAFAVTIDRNKSGFDQRRDPCAVATMRLSLKEGLQERRDGMNQLFVRASAVYDFYLQPGAKLGVRGASGGHKARSAVTFLHDPFPKSASTSPIEADERPIGAGSFHAVW